MSSTHKHSDYPNVLGALTIAVAFCMIASCKPAAQTYNYRSPQGACTPQQPNCKSATSVGNITPEGDATSVVYPKMTFSGHGTLHHPDLSGGQADIAQKPVTTDTSATELNVFIGSFTSSDSHVNDSVSSQTGTSKYQRTSKEALQAAVTAGKVSSTGMMIFADRATNPKGQVFVFETPFPVFVVPAAESRYDVLKKGPVTYNTVVTGRGALSMSVEYVGTGNGVVTLRTTITPGFDDGNGAFWADFPMTHTSEYEIDTASTPLVIRALRTTTYYLDTSKGKGRQNVELNYSLCIYEQAGSPTKNYGCN